ncbi:hypothetical protein B0H14DRAFT_2640202 [Mycena olivaceomarginata]|nr:hypothetical protein B0H14DRAFT_2640202 [Mycena olivaceomarginata]
MGGGRLLATEIFGGLIVQCVVGYLDRNLSFKEGDNTLMPLSRTPTDLPSVVIEMPTVGMGMAGPSQVKLVILVHLHKDSRSTTKRVEIEFREQSPSNPIISCESTSCPTLEWWSAIDVTDLNIPVQ